MVAGPGFLGDSASLSACKGVWPVLRCPFAQEYLRAGVSSSAVGARWQCRGARCSKTGNHLRQQLENRLSSLKRSGSSECATRNQKPWYTRPQADHSGAMMENARNSNLHQPSNPFPSARQSLKRPHGHRLGTAQPAGGLCSDGSPSCHSRGQPSPDEGTQ